MDEQFSSCSEAEPFALRVIGDSMEPEFRDGCIIIIDPTGVARPGAYVLAAQGEEFIFRQLAERDGLYYLAALNARYPDLPLPNGLGDVRGVVVQQAGRRRRDRKFYDREPPAG
jgi:SOS-response transcriptional repressor LexA